SVSHSIVLTLAGFIALATFFFVAPLTPKIYTLSLHDALPISTSAASTPTRMRCRTRRPTSGACSRRSGRRTRSAASCSRASPTRSEEHTSELQSHLNLVCRLLLEKKNQNGAPMARRLTRTGAQTPDVCPLAALVSGSTAAAREASGQVAHTIAKAAFDTRIPATAE